MLRKLVKSVLFALGIMIMVVRLAMAGTPGTVVDVDDKGIVTIETEDGKEYKVKISGAQVGDEVECDMKDGKMVCTKK